jgi:imidazolonepropionase-like amidohydrolase
VQVSQREKAALVASGLDHMMQLAKKYNVKVAFGTDVFGSPRAFAMESGEFGARLRWFTSLEILRQATSINGDLLAMSGPRNPYGRLGVIEPGALADVLIVAVDPLQDIRVLEKPEQNLLAIIKDGKVVRSSL